MPTLAPNTIKHFQKGPFYRYFMNITISSVILIWTIYYYLHLETTRISKPLHPTFWEQNC